MKIINNTSSPTPLEIHKGFTALNISTTHLMSLDDSKATIDLYVDSDEKDLKIATSYPLLPFMLLSTMGDGAIIQTQTGFNALCDLTDLGNIQLKEKESVRLEIAGLNPDNKITVNTVEYPVNVGNLRAFSRKTLQTDTTERTVNVENDTHLLIKNIDTVKTIQLNYSTGESVKYTADEIKIISNDFDPFKVVNSNGSVSTSIDTYSSLLLHAVKSIDIVKNNGVVELFTKS